MMVREGKRKILGLLDGQVTPVVLPVNPGYISLKLSSISKVLTTLFKLFENLHKSDSLVNLQTGFQSAIFLTQNKKPE